MHSVVTGPVVTGLQKSRRSNYNKLREKVTADLDYPPNTIFHLFIQARLQESASALLSSSTIADSENGASKDLEDAELSCPQTCKLQAPQV